MARILPPLRRFGGHDAWCGTVRHTVGMSRSAAAARNRPARDTTRLSVSLPPDVAAQVDDIARAIDASSSRGCADAGP
jgi:hypothetical protein